MASIYLGFKGRTYISKDSGGIDLEISVTEELYDKCCSFKVRKYKIDYSSLDDTSQATNLKSYTLNIRNGYPSSNLFSGHVQNIFSYFPGSYSDTVDKVDSYYLSNTDIPFALVFTTGKPEKIYYTYDQLKRDESSSTLRGTPIKDGNLCRLLHGSCKSHKCENFTFRLGSGHTNVNTNELNIGTDNKFKKIIFTPKPADYPGTESVLHSGSLFTNIANNVLDNIIDDSYLSEVKDRNFNSVIVYYTVSAYPHKDLAILIEFVKGCETTHIRRTCKKPPIWLKRDVPYIDDDDLIGQLDNIKEEAEAAITYKLDKNNNDDGYQDVTIKVAEEKTAFGSGFNVYKHTLQRSRELPILLYKDKQIQIVENKKIAHNNDTLKPSDGDILREISTYALSDNANEHLLIKVTINHFNYYLYRFSNNGVRWRQLALEDFVGFGSISDHEMDEVRRKSQGGLGKQIEQVLQDPEKTKILLEEVRFNIKSIIILLENKFGYCKSDIDKLIGIEGSERDIPPVDINTNTITVTYGTDVTNSGCLDSNGYNVYKHDLRTAGTRAKEKSNKATLYLRFYLDNKLIRLYNSIKGKHTPLEYKDNVNDLYVYYYGHKDPRPLLLCYGDQTYRPNSVTDYETKWVREMRISKCVCQNNDDDKNLLSVLSDVVGILNAVQLKRPEFIKPESGSKTYNVHKFNGEQIRIKFSYEDKKCYRVYTHEPDGTVSNSSGYRLGNIKYDIQSPENSVLEYKLSEPLLKVSAYYSVYDVELQHPLLVVLEFQGSENKDYYKLTKSDKPYKWEKIKSEGEGGTGDDPAFIEKLQDLEKKSQESASSEIPDKLQEAIEKKAYKIRSDLGIKFEDQKNYLFDPNDCKEDRINWVAVGAGSGGGVVAVGTVVTAGVLVSKNLATAAVATAAATTAAL